MQIDKSSKAWWIKRYGNLLVHEKHYRGALKKANNRIIELSDEVWRLKEKLKKRKKA